MRKPGRTFSESWHRVAELKMRLKPTVETWKQFFRGEEWHVLHDPFNNQFFRLRPAAYEFVSRLRSTKIVEEVWKECLAKFPDDAPGQEDVIQLLTQLYFANLLYFESDIDSSSLFERYKKRKRQEVRSRLMSIMFLRIPLWDPDAFLNKIKPLIYIVVSLAGALIWLVAVGWAGKLTVEHFSVLTAKAQGILAPQNIFWLYIALVVLKALHEMGHVMVCKRFEGEVHTMGVMLLIFTPLPYMDATSSWTFRRRWKRVLVGAAGILTEIFVAALAMLAWVHSGPGMWHELAYNLVIIASISTVIFNANPLLRFDGYYILSDLLDIPNLHQRSKDFLRFLLEKFVFGVKDLPCPTESKKEGFWLTFFGILSSLYRILVFTGIVLFIADKLFIVGLILAFICFISWILVPLFKFLQYLLFSPGLSKNRTRAVGGSAAVFLLLIAGIGYYPLASHFRAPGVVQSADHYRVLSEASGYVQRVITEQGKMVHKGDVLIEMTNPQLQIKRKELLARKKEILAVQTQARKSATADLAPIAKQLEAIEAKLEKNQERRELLTVHARQDGVWIAPKLNELKGMWVTRGRKLGDILALDKFEFLAVVSQTKASDLFGDEIQKAGVKIRGEVEKTLDVQNLEFIPYEQRRLPSAALGWQAGGEVRTSLRDKQGLKTAEPFFLIPCRLNHHPVVACLHRPYGVMRLALPDKPLGNQLLRKLRQLLQKRYQL